MTRNNPLIFGFPLSSLSLCNHARLTSDYTTIASDLPTLLGVITGIFTLAGLICMVLHLFSKTKYPRTRTFADAHAGPPVFFASDTGDYKMHIKLRAAELKVLSLSPQEFP